MSQRKHCFYKGCTSKQIPGIPSDLTFFQFPRDEIRYNLWMKLSRCENKDSPVKYLCSNHFDERKYISRNPRRLLLLASALPYEYVSGDEDNIDHEIDNEEEQIQVVTSKSDDEDVSLQCMDISEFTAEAEAACSFAESTIHEVEYVQDDVPSKSYEFISKKRKWHSDAENAIATMKTSESMVYQSDKNQISTSNCDDHISRITQENMASKKHQKSDKDELLDNPDITTFIFKGEEYIQMPKRIYAQEKNDLIADIEYYKAIVMNIKSQIDDAKI